MALSQRLPRRYAQSPSDVFCLLKQNLCDECWQQDALLVWPGDEVAQTEAFLQRVVNHRGIHASLDSDRSRDLLDLCAALRTYPQYGRAIEYMQRLAGQKARQRQPSHPINFIASAVRPGNVPEAVLPDRERARSPYRLQVRFHRPS